MSQITEEQLLSSIIVNYSEFQDRLNELAARNQMSDDQITELIQRLEELQHIRHCESCQEKVQFTPESFMKYLRERLLVTQHPRSSDTPLH